MSCKRSQIVAQAQAWVDLKESDGSFKPIIDIYNSNKPLARGYKLKYTDAWCSGFSSAVAIACGAADIIPTEVGCQKHIDLFKKMGIWVEDDAYVPSPADYIFYDWKDDGKGENTDGASHVGIVEKVEDGMITVIEGNMDNGAVGRRKIAVNGKYIRGYGVPKYDDEEADKLEVIYRVFTDGRWWSAIAGSDNHAGVFGKTITDIQVWVSDCKPVTIQTHTFSGWTGEAIDCIAMKAEGHQLRYRVHIKGGKWLPWVTGCDINNYAHGLAGVYGKPIDAVQIDVVE